jgi:hypothetical protein
MTARREMTLSIALVVVGALVTLLAGGKVHHTGGAVPTSGGRSGASALGLVSLAGGAALLLVGRWARRVLGLLLSLAGLGIVVWAVAEGSSSGWTALAIAGGGGVSAGGAVALTRCGRWPAPGRRFAAGAPGQAESRRPARDTWEALDRGEDPTA